MDFGADESAECGFVDVLKIYSNIDDFPGWYAGETEILSLTGWLDCQLLCSMDEECVGFYFEENHNTLQSECFLKAG